MILLGPPGLGKTHLAIGLGVKAAHAGYSVLFDTANNWIIRLAEAHQAGRLEAELKKIRRYKLIIIDEVGYIPFDQDAANLFFQLIASRYEVGSVMVTTNLPFGRWGETFSDDVVAAAMIDRLVHHAEVLTLTGDSYRTRQRRELLAKQPRQPGLTDPPEGSVFTRRSTITCMNLRRVWRLWPASSSRSCSSSAAREPPQHSAPGSAPPPTPCCATSGTYLGFLRMFRWDVTEPYLPDLACSRFPGHWAGRPASGRRRCWLPEPAAGRSRWIRDLPD